MGLPQAPADLHTITPLPSPEKATKGETMGRYGKRYSVRVLYDEAVVKLDYGVDLEHLKGSKWVIPIR